jgi:hypothetical protein
MSRTLACASFVVAGCLGPLASDVPGSGHDILPAGTKVPALTDDPVERARLAEHDGVDGVVRLTSAFAGSSSIRVWDFGPAPTFAAPLMMIATRDAGGQLVRVPHNTIIASLPGDPGYSPFWAISAVEVTDRYAGEILPSFAAVDQAVQSGLVLPPVALGFAVNCPAVAPDVRVAVGGGQTLPPNATFYYEGKTVPYFDFGKMPLSGVLVPEQRRFQLRREGQEPLSEAARNIDMTGDGDIDDSNDIFMQRPGTPTTTPLARLVTVVVPLATSSIDDSRDETVAALTDALQLFGPAPTSSVVGYRETEELHNWITQQTSGGL